MKNSLSSSDLLTVQVLQNELQNPTIPYTYRNEIIARIIHIQRSEEITTHHEPNYKYSMKGT